MGDEEQAPQRRSFWSAVKEDPLPPIGALVTIGVLTMGVGSMFKRNPEKSQYWMRARIFAQAATVAFVMFSLSRRTTKTQNDDD
jgi:hypothetical protein